MSEQKGFEENPEIIEHWLVNRISDEMKVSPDSVNREEPFAAFGLDSIVWVTLANDLADWIGREIDPTIFWEYDNIHHLSRWIAEGSSIEPN